MSDKIKVVGVNHCLTEEFSDNSIRFIPAQVTTNMLDFLNDKTVGLEMIEPDMRKDILKKFYFPNGPDICPKGTMEIYHPLHLEFFYNLSKHCKNTVESLDTGQFHEDMIDYSHKYADIAEKIYFEVHRCNPINSEHFVLLYDEIIQEQLEFDSTGMNAEEAYYKHCELHSKKRINPELFLKMFKIYLTNIAINNSCREDHMISQINTLSPEIAVVGLGHAVSMKNRGFNQFEYYMEDTFNGIRLQELDESKFTDQIINSLESVLWLDNLTKNNRILPDFVGVLEPFSPHNYFELFQRSTAGFDWKEDQYMMDNTGKHSITINSSGSVIRLGDFPGKKGPVNLHLNNRELYKGRLDDGRKIIVSDRFDEPFSFLKELYKDDEIVRWLSRITNYEYMHPVLNDPPEEMRAISKEYNKTRKDWEIPF